MADVLIVCVREDEPQAKALADMFEAAGFSIGGAPSNDAALRSSGAGVVVWSQASIRSRPFLDAAQRVVNAGKAVVASLIEPPPASSIGSSPSFDLSHWDGDPNDPALDPLFFAVDRMVNSARAAVGSAAPAAEQAYDPPPRAAPAAPRSSATPRRSGPSAEHLGSEAEHWRAIRESRDPADFMDYLARFGPDGAFADVAELRLKQLTDSDRGPARPAHAARSSAAPRVSPRSPARADAPARRSEAAAPWRTEPPPPPRRPLLERGHERVEQHEPPRGEGGPLRALVLISVLGVALAAGLYFGGGIPGFGPAPTPPPDRLEASTPPPPSDEPIDAAALGAESDAVSLSDAARPGPIETAARREPAPRAAAPRSQPEEDGPPPRPVTSWQSGGPLSLTTPGQSPASPGDGVVPLVPPPAAPATETLVAAVAPPAAATVSWAQRPSARRIAELYPQRGLREGVGGRVQLDCTVQTNLAVACAIVSETPAGIGFGRAALSAATAYRAQPTRSDGASSIGARARITVNFQAPSP